MNNLTENTAFGIIKTSSNLKLINKLEKENLKLIEFPEPNFQKISYKENNINFNDKIQTFDWLIFLDILAVKFFLENSQEINFDLFQLDNFRVCSLGEAVSDRLRFVQIHSDLIPTSTKINLIVKEIIDYISDIEEFRNTKFLIVKEISEKEKIGEMLRIKGAFSENLEVYKTLDIEKEIKTKFKTLLLGGAVDKFILTKPIDFLMIQKFFGIEDVKKLFDDIEINVLDEVTQNFLRENGLNSRLLNQKKG